MAAILLFAGCSGPFEHERYRSPGGRYTLVVRAVPDGLGSDLLYPLTIKQSWLRPTLTLGCINGDWGGFVSARWIDDDSFIVEAANLGSGTVEVTVDIVGDELVEHPLTEHLHSC